ncbi:MAG TPA: 30S ribosome-binding factor RbfA [Candidatus Latescibacteria bacterium]|nr:30S ribosome-binding factor RbfA [Candidatus Latescibacterota bacterium]
MSFSRMEKVGSLLRREISSVLRTKVKDPRVRSVAVTGVEVTEDLRHARAYVSVMGSPQEQKEAIEGLNRASKFIRAELGRRLRIKRVPEIAFLRDTSYEYGAHIEELLRKVREEA